LLQLKDTNAKTLITNLNTQVFVYKSQSDQFRNLYQTTSDELVKQKANTPSRLTWLTIGVVSALTLILGGMFALK
jgi:hypothetical protein